MTWKEFKEIVESYGVKDDMEIWYIDISLNHTLLVELPSKEQNLVIYN